MKTAVVLPTYNEIDNLKELVTDIFSALPDTDVIIVDDNSPDGTGRLADGLSKEDCRIKVIHRLHKTGLRRAYVEGFRYALSSNYDFIFEMDADFSHDPRYLPELLKNTSDRDVALGSRYVRGAAVADCWTWRRLISYTGNLYARFVLGLPYRDLTSGFKCFSQNTLRNIEISSFLSTGYAFQIETIYKAHRKGYKIKEIPIVFKEREKGKSKTSVKICFEIIWKVPLLRFCRIKK